MPPSHEARWTSNLSTDKRSAMPCLALTDKLIVSLFPSSLHNPIPASLIHDPAHGMRGSTCTHILCCFVPLWFRQIHAVQDVHGGTSVAWQPRSSICNMVLPMPIATIPLPSFGILPEVSPNPPTRPVSDMQVHAARSFRHSSSAFGLYYCMLLHASLLLCLDIGVYYQSLKRGSAKMFCQSPTSRG
jgi:hypothetical protein